MKQHLRYHVLVFAIFLIASTVSPIAYSADPGKTLTIAGTGSALGIMKLIAADFQKQHPGVTVTVLPSIGSTGGIKGVTTGKIDIGLAARPLKPNEQTPGIGEKIYGHTAVIFGVQTSNTVDGLHLTEIEEIYAARRRAWPDGTPVRIILRPMSDAYSQFLAGISPGMRSAHELARTIPGVAVGITDRDAAALIERTPGSFGVTSAAIVAAERRKIKALSVDGAAPTLSNIATGKYPYIIPMSVVYKDNASDTTKDFIDFVFSTHCKRILEANGYVAAPRTARK